MVSWLVTLVVYGAIISNRVVGKWQRVFKFLHVRNMEEIIWKWLWIRKNIQVLLPASCFLLTATCFCFLLNLALQLSGNLKNQYFTWCALNQVWHSSGLLTDVPFSILNKQMGTNNNNTQPTKTTSIFKNLHFLHISTNNRWNQLFSNPKVPLLLYSLQP